MLAVEKANTGSPFSPLAGIITMAFWHPEHSGKAEQPSDPARTGALPTCQEGSAVRAPEHPRPSTASLLPLTAVLTFLPSWTDPGVCNPPQCTWAHRSSEPTILRPLSRACWILTHVCMYVPGHGLRYSCTGGAGGQVRLPPLAHPPCCRETASRWPRPTW